MSVSVFVERVENFQFRLFLLGDGRRTFRDRFGNRFVPREIDFHQTRLVRTKIRIIWRFVQSRRVEKRFRARFWTMNNFREQRADRIDENPSTHRTKLFLWPNLSKNAFSSFGRQSEEKDFFSRFEFEKNALDSVSLDENRTEKNDFSDKIFVFNLLRFSATKSELQVEKKNKTFQVQRFSSRKSSRWNRNFLSSHNEIRQTKIKMFVFEKNRRVRQFRFRVSYRAHLIWFIDKPTIQRCFQRSEWIFL